MISNKDVKKLKGIFATKEDLKSLKKEFIDKFVTKIEFRREMKKIDIRFDSVIDGIKDVINMVGEALEKDKEQDDILDDHEHRLDKLDAKVFSTS